MNELAMAFAQYVATHDTRARELAQQQDEEGLTELELDELIAQLKILHS